MEAKRRTFLISTLDEGECISSRSGRFTLGKEFSDRRLDEPHWQP